MTEDIVKQCKTLYMDCDEECTFWMECEQRWNANRGGMMTKDNLVMSELIKIKNDLLKQELINKEEFEAIGKFLNFIITNEYVGYYEL